MSQVQTWQGGGFLRRSGADTRDDLAPATPRGYRYDLRHFLAWLAFAHELRKGTIDRWALALPHSRGAFSSLLLPQWQTAQFREDLLKERTFCFNDFLGLKGDVPDHGQTRKTKQLMLDTASV